MSTQQKRKKQMYSEICTYCESGYHDYHRCPWRVRNVRKTQKKLNFLQQNIYYIYIIPYISGCLWISREGSRSDWQCDEKIWNIIFNCFDDTQWIITISFYATTIIFSSAGLQIIIWYMTIYLIYIYSHDNIQIVA